MPDPDAILRKPRSTLDRWRLYARADAEYDDWKAAEAKAELERSMKG
jgi:hypothetical protein